MGLFQDLIGIIIQIGDGPTPSERGGGYYDSVQGRENQMRDSIERHRAIEAQRQRERAAAQSPAQPARSDHPQPVSAPHVEPVNPRSRIGQLSALGRDQEDWIVNLEVVDARFHDQARDLNRKLNSCQHATAPTREAHRFALIAAMPGSIKSDELAPPAEWLPTALALVDLALNFTPGLSLAKDILCLVNRVNPITGETVGDVEYGIIAATILLPGVTHGVASGLRKVKSLVAITGHRADAQTLVPFIEKAIDFSKAAHVDVEVATEALPVLRKISSALVRVGPLVVESASVRRGSPGTVKVSSQLYDGRRLIRGRPATAGLMPEDVARLLDGRTFRSFNEMREAFWKAVVDTKYAKEFGESNLGRMRLGKAPFAPQSQSHGQQVVYQLHHIQPIQRGGDVYDLSNIMIVSPKFHQDVLLRAYHFGN